VDFQLTKRYATYGLALYVNSIVMQKFGIGKKSGFIKKLIRKSKSIFSGLKNTESGFHVYSPFSLPVHHIPLAKQLNDMLVRIQVQRVVRKLGINKPLIMVVCPGACDIAMKIKYRKLVYLRTDPYELFPNVDKKVIVGYDRRLKKKADITLFVSRKLYKSEKDQCLNPLYLDHGVDFEMFTGVDQEKERPADMRNIPKPVIGYFGTLDKHTVDVELIARVAELLPCMSFVFVGKIAASYKCLTERKNVYLVGMKPYEQIPIYGNCFDVCIMPWQQTEWIEACNPIKLKEYLALGKPIVSIPFFELEKYSDVVYQARTPEEFASCIKQSLIEDSPERIIMRRKKVEKETWDSKAQLVLEKLFENDRQTQR